VIGVGLLGCGSIGPLHARALDGLRGARLIAAADLRVERAQAVAGPRQAQAVASLDELLAVPGVDLVIVCTASGDHAEHGERIASAGRHVVVEKPIDISLSAARRLIEVCGRAGVELSVISQHRFDTGLQRLHAALATGQLGPVVLAEARAWWYRTQSYYDADAWRGTWREDGGALSNQGVHLVDVLGWLLGPVESVFARATTAAHRMEAEDTLVANLVFASGVLANLTVTTAAYPGAPESVAVFGPEASVVVEAGQVVAWHAAKAAPGGNVGAGPDTGGDVGADPDPGGNVGADLDPGGNVGADPDRTTAARGSADLAVDAHRAQLQDVIDAIAEGRHPAVTGEDGLAALTVIHAAYESARTGRDVRVRVDGGVASTPT
jgi:UDP-N-acetyl-2-amino-2-deoxyglucuronate dehydrogenase